ncbi:hypothetical protein [Hyphococcus sp.]|uniref:hypothetical protein n=1 Tax=Hyphococcus sp. TaxID=2038636 RepID=UPI0020869FD8|nr:MAG: hypothetical protein DHS20C04_24070 [Marinicaulis sp.]
MILRRVIEHVKHQNWTAVALDFVIVVVGVFIGIQLGNLNEARVERVQLDQQLISLRIELQENQAHFATYRTELVQQMEDIAALRSAFKTPAPSIPIKEVNARLLNIARYKVFSPESAALEELAATGGLRRLAGDEIRKEISLWQRELDNVNRIYADGLNQRDNVFNPFILKSIAYGPLLEESYIVGDRVGASKFRNDVAALAEDREFDNQLAYRYGNTGATLNTLDALDLETARLIEMLRQREARQ